MGDHRVDGTFQGIGKLTVDPIKVRFTGTLDEDENRQFRAELKKLAKSFGLKVQQSPDKK